MLGFATEEIALRWVYSLKGQAWTLADVCRTGETIGGLLNASFG